MFVFNFRSLRESGKKKAHKHKLFCPADLGTTPGQTRAFSLFYTVEARQTRVCPWDKPSLSLGQSRERRAAQKVHVKKVDVPLLLARGWGIGGICRIGAPQVCPQSRRGAKGGTPQKIPRGTFLEAEGVYKKASCPFSFKRKGTS